MSINSLLALLKTDVPDVPGVPASSTATFSATSATANVAPAVAENINKNKGATSATAATSQTSNSELKTNQERAIRRWLAAIGETDPELITEVLDRCREDLEAREYFLGRATKEVTCQMCQHFLPVEGHSHLGHCVKGEPETVTGLWDSDRRLCYTYQQTEATP